MRILITIILLCLSFSTLANPTKQPEFQILPYKQTQEPVSKKHERICAVRAQISAKAFQNARIGVPVEAQLKKWDDFSLSKKSKNFAADELLLLRKLIAGAWVLSAKYPEATANEYGDAIFLACLQMKPKTGI